MKKFLGILGIVIVIIVLSFVALLQKGIKNTPEVHGVLTTFMYHASKNDVDSSYPLTTKGFQNSVTKMQLKKLLSYRALFDGFESIEQTGFRIKTSTSSSDEYDYTGVVVYKNGDRGSLDAIVLKEDGKYKIQYIHVTVSPDRFDKFNSGKPEAVLGVSTEK